MSGTEINCIAISGKEISSWFLLTCAVNNRVIIMEILSIGFQYLELTY